jgi:hypothetical protein
VKKCPRCNHIFYEHEKYECPTPEYIALRDRMVAEAIEEWENREVDEHGHPVEW